MELGYPLSIFPGKYDESFKCGKCRRILRRPVQVSCGHRFCQKCWERIIGESLTPVCPECRDNGDEQAEAPACYEARPDNGILRDMNKMTAYCQSSNCRWSGSFKDFQHHYLSCVPQSTEQEESYHSQAAAEDLTGTNPINRDELQLISDILTIFSAMTLYHVLCYFNHQEIVRIDHGHRRITRVSELQDDVVESMSGRVRALEEASYEGKSLWKIKNINLEIRDGDKDKVLQSPDIYTQKQGGESYKMRALLYPNGAQGHLSLHFVAITGQMDALMKWPFKAMVTVKFHDQTGEKRVHESFRASFNRPGLSGSGNSHGFSKFLSHSSLLPKDGARCNPIDEDAVFIEIEIEDEGPCNGTESNDLHAGVHL